MAVIPVLYHATILVPYDFLTTPPASITELFTLTRRGRHSDGFIESKIVLFEDGTYLDFIAYVPDVDLDAREHHRYGKCEEGTVVDWAVRFISKEEGPEALSWEKQFEAMQLRVRDAGTGVIYLEPVDMCIQAANGSSHRYKGSYPEQGGHLEWTRELDIIPGEVPFWVFDPSSTKIFQGGEDNTRHPSGVTGLASIEVNIRTGKDRVRSEHRLGLLWETLQTLFGEEPIDVVDEGKQIETWEWPVGVPAGEKPVKRHVRLTSPEAMEGNVEIKIGLMTRDNKIMDLQISNSVNSVDVMLRNHAPTGVPRRDFRWEWMR
ncbi:hypothetical protein F4779DRAFT_588988 [Xylariaceae sp. FL0662B]|nr:hypothetical protein F4779DRAFT_588988 [Xylariaceae sp. FL0662B]